MLELELDRLWRKAAPAYSLAHIQLLFKFRLLCLGMGLLTVGWASSINLTPQFPLPSLVAYKD